VATASASAITFIIGLIVVIKNFTCVVVTGVAIETRLVLVVVTATILVAAIVITKVCIHISTSSLAPCFGFTYFISKQVVILKHSLHIHPN
jgi:hypothetical protein